MLLGFMIFNPVLFLIDASRLEAALNRMYILAKVHKKQAPD